MTFWLVNSSERGCCCDVLDAELFTFFVLCRKGNSPKTTSYYVPVVDTVCYKINWLLAQPLGSA